LTTETFTAEWYDAAYLEYPPYADTPMRHMYKQVAKMIPRLAPVIDLGCGNGYLASALQEANYIGEYVGLDYSPVAIEMAAACFQNRQLVIPEFENFSKNRYSFQVQDLQNWEPEVTGDTHETIYTCFEVLEHVPSDTDIVNLVPARSRFIFSVPNYWSRSHIRTFDSVGVAFTRFPQLSFKSWYILPTKQPEAAIYLYDTYRRADKW
jgi:2-polyprenyl-3-methyl-5-hydroxy-6-metoxy-1,4-benzoquinol methylase